MWSQRDPSLRKSGLGNVFVRNLDRKIDNKALYDTFSLFGQILSCKVGTDPAGKSRGYGFVHYSTEEAARQAIERVNGMQIGDKTVQVTSFIKRGERDTSGAHFTNLYAKNFPQDWDEAKIQEVFGQFGTITSTCMMNDAIDRKFCFVNFEKSECAKKALEMLNGTDQRTEEQKEQDRAEGKENSVVEGEQPSWLMYVTRAQTKSERNRDQREHFNDPSRGVNLFIKNLHDNTDNDDLKALFSAFGTITSAIAMKDERGNCKGFGFVCFQTSEEATKAVTEMHLKVVKGKPLYVGLAEKREVRQDRLRQRYSPSDSPGVTNNLSMGESAMGSPGLHGGKGGKGCGKPGAPTQMLGGCPGMNGPGMGGPGMAGMPTQMGMYMPGGGVPQPGIGSPHGMMYPPQMMGMKGPPMIGPRGPMMGGQMSPQMMAQIGKGAAMQGMVGKGMPPGGMMGGPGMMGPGMSRPPMPSQQQQQQMSSGNAPQQQQHQQTMLSEPLTAGALAAAPAPVRKQMLGEKLFPAISRHQPELAGKITGMMLEMDNSELLMLLESEQALKSKVDEAMRVLETSRS
jgi:polyadenylate-binding protein